MKEIENSYLSNQHLFIRFMNSVMKFGERPAIAFGDVEFSYAQLFQMSIGLSSEITKHTLEEERFVAIFDKRNFYTYTAVLATLLAGKGYVPLNPEFPIERNKAILDITDIGCFIVGPDYVDEFLMLLDEFTMPVCVIFCGLESTETYKEHYPMHHFVFFKPSFKNQIILNLKPHPDDIAYLLFTSGSTGVPKGVPVSNRNVVSYINNFLSYYNIKETDRCSQTFDLTFDLSVHDMFVTWCAGACLCVVPEKDLLAPAKFIREQNITVWFSVPSMGKIMSKLRLLKPNSFPSLRYSFFCGEALTQKMTEEWQKAAPYSKIVNLYGPTETTIAIARYEWNKDSAAKCINGIVPIGRVFETQQHCIINDSGEITEPGETGKLCLSGSQVTAGYLNNPEKTAEHYITIAGKGETLWYRTGDIVKEDADGCLHFLGRADDQVKIRGYRVELQEIEAVVRNVSKTDLVVVIPLKQEDGSVNKLIAIVCGKGDEAKLLKECKKFLPDYMLPEEIRFIETMPFTPAGKIDRVKLSALI